jgi:hypothetical protein
MTQVRIGIAIRKKSGSGSFVTVVRCCIKNLSFSVNALAQSRSDQRGSGDFPKTAVKIALSKSIISRAVRFPSSARTGTASNWHGKPLVSHEVIVNLISATTTQTSLKVRAKLDTNSYPPGAKDRTDKYSSRLVPRRMEL